MQLTITLTGEANPDIVQSLIAGLSGVTTSVTAERETKKPAKKTTAAKKETAPAKDPEPDSDAPSFEAIRKLVHAKAGAGLKKEIKKVLSDFGVETVPKLTKDQYADFYAKINEL